LGTRFRFSWEGNENVIALVPKNLHDARESSPVRRPRSRGNAGKRTRPEKKPVR
jgi:hypothetical protein